MKSRLIKPLLQVLPVCLFVVLLAGCVQPTASSSSTDGQGIDVFFIPFDDFSFDLTAQLATSLSQELGLRIKPAVQMGAAGLAPFPGTTQYSGNDILNLAGQAVPNFPESRTNTAYIVLTRRDLNTGNRAMRFIFTVHDLKRRIAVVSSARLMLENNSGGLADEETVRARVKKIVKRSIGDVYFGYQRSTDLRDLMYSPIMSLSDVDRMGNDFIHAHDKK